MTKQDIIEYVMYTPYNTNRAVLSSMLNQLIEGGGGSSDFSTATVTFVVSADDHPAWIGACAEGANPVCMSDHAEGTIKGENGTKTVILYKGYAFIRPEWNDGLTISVSGNASKDIYDNVTITGDCTITIS